MLIFRNSLIFGSKTACPLISQFRKRLNWGDVCVPYTNCNNCVKQFTLSATNLVKYNPDNEWTDTAFSERYVKTLKQPKVLLNGLNNFAGEFGKLYEEKKEKLLLNTKRLQGQDPIDRRENIYTIPNVLCVTRMALSPFLGYLIVFNHFEYALAFLIVASVSDLVDGWIARNYKNQASKIGTFLDPMADKVLIGTLFLSLTYNNLIPVALTALIIGRDTILITCGFVIRYKSLPPPRTLSRYFDATHATAQLAPTLISKVNTGVQLTLVATTLVAPIMGYADHQYLHAMWYVTGASTIAAAASYIFSKETYKYLKKPK